MWYERTLLALCAPLLVLSACIQNNDSGNDDGVTTGASCEELCPAMTACDAQTTLEECEANCDLQRDVFNANAWNTFTGCMMDDSCTDSFTCLQQAIEVTSPAPAQQFVADLCEWAAGCAQGQISVQECIEAVTELGSEDATTETGNPWDYMRLIRTSTLSCLGGCFQDLGCTEADFEQATGNCMQQCGLEALFAELTEDGETGVETAP